MFASDPERYAASLEDEVELVADEPPAGPTVG
jgi:hypothetical protein